jgi:excisionase family DNA binding protein
MTKDSPIRILFTVAELCEATGLGRTTLYSQIKMGRLRAHKCGRRTLFRAAEVEAWLSALSEISPRATADVQLARRGISASDPGGDPRPNQSAERRTQTRSTSPSKHAANDVKKGAPKKVNDIDPTPSERASSRPFKPVD